MSLFWLSIKLMLCVALFSDLGTNERAAHTLLLWLPLRKFLATLLSGKSNVFGTWQPGSKFLMLGTVGSGVKSGFTTPAQWTHIKVKFSPPC